MKQKGIAHVFLLVIIVIIGMGFVGYLAYQNAQLKNDNKDISSPAKITIAPSPTPDSTPAENSYQYTYGSLIESGSMEITEPQWTHLTSKAVGVSFDYPIPHAGKVKYTFYDFGEKESDPSGQIYNWEYHITDPSVSSWRYSIASGISSDFKQGRSIWYTDFHQLEKKDYDNVISTYKTKYGTDALLKFAPDIMSLELSNDMIIITNLPITKDTRFKGMAIYVKDGLSNADAARIINSITVE